VLSPNVRINSYSRVEDSVLMEGVEVGRYAKIRNAIIDEYVKIPPGMSIGYDIQEDRKRFTVTSSGIVVIPTGAVRQYTQKAFQWQESIGITREILPPDAIAEGLRTQV